MAPQSCRLNCRPAHEPVENLDLVFGVVQEHSRVVRLPVNVYELLGKINKVAQRLNSEPDRRTKATYDEIGDYLLLAIPAF